MAKITTPDLSTVTAEARDAQRALGPHADWATRVLQLAERHRLARDLRERSRWHYAILRTWVVKG